MRAKAQVSRADLVPGGVINGNSCDRSMSRAHWFGTRQRSVG